MQQRYLLTMQNLFTINDGVISGGKAEIALLEDDMEVDRLNLTGKVGPGESIYCRDYVGKPGLRAKLLTGVGQITFEAT